MQWTFTKSAVRAPWDGAVKYRFTAGCQRSGGIGAAGHNVGVDQGRGPAGGRQARSRRTPVRASDEPEQGATMNRKSQRAEIALHRARVSDSFQELLAGTEDLLRSTARIPARRSRPRAAAQAPAGRGPRIGGRVGKRRPASAPAALRSTRMRSCTSTPGNRRAWPRWWGCCWDAAWRRAAGAERPRRAARSGTSAVVPQERLPRWRRRPAAGGFSLALPAIRACGPAPS